MTMSIRNSIHYVNDCAKYDNFLESLTEEKTKNSFLKLYKRFLDCARDLDQSAGNLAFEPMGFENHNLYKFKLIESKKDLEFFIQDYQRTVQQS